MSQHKPRRRPAQTARTHARETFDHARQLPPDVGYPPAAGTPPMVAAPPTTGTAPRPRARPAFSREAHPIQRDLTRFAWVFFVLNLILIGLVVLYFGMAAWEWIGVAIDHGELGAIAMAVIAIVAVLIAGAIAALMAYFEFLLLRAVAVAVKCLAAIADHTR